MNKYIFLLAGLFLCTGLSAQEGIKLGLHGSFPFNDFSDAVVLAAGIDVGYMHALGEVVDAGIMTGFINGFPDNFDGGSDLPKCTISSVGRLVPYLAFQFLFYWR